MTAGTEKSGYNGGVKCDVKDGPCACGAWHTTEKATDIPVRDDDCNCTLYHLSDCSALNPSPVPQSFSPTDHFQQIIQEILSTHTKKSKDYGSSTNPYANIRASTEFGIPAWVGAVVRANDKTTRIKSFIQRGELANEPIRDALLDAATYYAIALMLYDEGLTGE